VDNSNSQVPPAAPVIPETPQPAAVPTPESGGGKTKLWIIIGLVVLLLILGGVYFYLSSQKNEAPEDLPQTTTQASPTPVPINNLESDANSIEIESTDGDFATVDADLKNL